LVLTPNDHAENSLFAGSERGGHTWATIATLLQTAKMNDVEPLAWLYTDVSTHGQPWPAQDIEALMPWNFKPDVVG
jgi:transposase